MKAVGTHRRLLSKAVTAHTALMRGLTEWCGEVGRLLPSPGLRLCPGWEGEGGGVLLGGR